ASWLAPRLCASTLRNAKATKARVIPNDRRLKIMGANSSISEADADGARGTHDVVLRIHHLGRADGLGDRHGADGWAAQANHVPELTLRNQLHGGHTEARAQDAVKR